MNPSAGDEFCPLGRREVRAKLGGSRFRSLRFQIRGRTHVFSVQASLMSGWTKGFISTKGRY